MSAPSSRGLFHATGKTSKPVAGRDETGAIVKVAARARQADDFEPTPPEPTRALIAAEGGRLHDFPAIWEPAAGDGAMVRELEADGLEVCASDLVDRGCGAEIRSFYDFHRAPAPAIVTNPPFQECSFAHGRMRWQLHALETLGVEYMALLLPWQWPGAGGLAGFWKAHPPAFVYLMRWRIDFTGMGASPMLNAWFVWDKAHRGETVLRVLDRIDPRQEALL